MAQTNRLVKGGGALFIVFIIYLVLFVTKAEDYVFGMVGGYVGAVSALIVMLDIYIRSYSGASFNLLFWRAFCDFGLGLRFIFIPAYNRYICNNGFCDRESGDENKCGVPAVFMEFFILASEAWFLCSGLDLFYTVTNPFSRFEPRLKYYHLFSWAASILITLFPFIVGVDQTVYGFWYVSADVNDQAFCWIKIQSDDTLGWPMTVFFFVPLNLIYIINLIVLFIAYNRLRKGLTRSFLPRLKLLVSSTVHVFVLVLFWLIFFIIYGSAFYNRDYAGYNGNLSALVNSVIASKGFSSFMIWLLATETEASDKKNSGTEQESDEQKVKAQDNVALREELLSFATAGIRSTARAGPTVTPSKTMIVRRPQQAHENNSNMKNMITPYFFIKFMLGERDQINTVEKIVSGHRRSVDENFMRQTMADQSLTSDNLNANGDSFGSNRLSQRSTLVSGVQPSTLFKASNGSIQSFSIDNSGRESNFGGNDGPNRADSISSGRTSDMVDVDDDSYNEITAKYGVVLGYIYDRLSTWFLLDRSDAVEFAELQPYHFRRVRISCGVTDDVYISSFSTTIKERLTEGGASGAFFFYSKDEKLIAKSCSEEEFEVLGFMAPSYADYMLRNKKSYIGKIFGAYRLKIYGNSLHFFVMNNLFFNKDKLTMNEKYDIKGSWVARNAKPPIEGKILTCSYCEQKFVYRKSTKKTRSDMRTYSNGSFSARKSHIEMSNMNDGGSGNKSVLSPLANMMAETSETPTRRSSFVGNIANYLSNPPSKDGPPERLCPYTVNGLHEPNVILKDNDMKYKIRLSAETAAQMINQLRSDSEFLLSLQMMDYSLLVGVHNKEYEVEGYRSRSKSRFTTTSTQGSDYAEGGKDRSRTASSESELLEPSGSSANQIEDDSTGEKSLQLANRLDVMRVIGPDSYYIGIIDFQQRWNIKKKLERFFKTNFRGADPRGLSAIEPVTYKERFLRKVEDILDLDDAYRLGLTAGGSSNA